jgi:cytochrome c oxidase subunit III
MNNALALPPQRAPADIGLWVFFCVASTLFALFVTAYAMRMDRAPDWSAIGMPWQLWLSTGLLIAGSVLLQRAATRDSQRALWAGGLCALAFVASQLWAWQTLAAARVSFSANPAASFFYLLTAMHGLHVVGGLAAWAGVLQRPRRERVALVARYWHFLLAVWLVLFAVLGWLTPEVVAFICGRGAIS